MFVGSAFVGHDLRKSSVLLADDNSTLLERVARHLKSSYRVVGQTGDGQALFEAALDLNPDVIITDISMPVLNGIEAVSRLKDSGCKAKVVFLTVHADPDIAHACLSRGALGYVMKPRIATDLLPAIQSALAGRTFVSENLRYQIPA